MARRESALGTQTLSKGTGPPLERGTLSTQSPEAALPTDRGAAMSRNETAPDTHGLSTDKPQMCPVAVDAGNPLSARPATASAPSKMRETSCDHPGRSGSTSRHQQEGSHGQARVALGTRTSQQGHRATPTERDSVHAESGSSAAHRQGRRHEQERDSSRHSRTEHGQTSDVFGSRTRRESSVSPASDSERSSK
nr:filaggrin-like [Camelus dromedarius]